MTKRVSHDEDELAAAIRAGADRRHEQLFGGYFEGRTRSDALGSAYEGLYRLPADATGIRPRGIYKLFHCLDDRIRHCPAPGCHKIHMLDTLIVHLNDDHRWSREQIATWLEGRQAEARAGE